MAQTFSFTVQSGDAGKRIDKFLGEKLAAAASRSRIKKIIEDKLVLLNAKQVKPHQLVKERDAVSLTIPDASSGEDIAPANIPLDILFEDADLLVINKPAGMVVHPAAGHYRDTLANALIYHSRRLSDINGFLRPGIVHRLDKDTSGVLVAAKHNAAHRFLAQQFKQHTVKRVYTAVVNGVMECDQGEIDAPIARNPANRKKMAVRYVRARNSRTAYRVIRRGQTMSVLEIYPRTGRTHQIRVHLAHTGHPVAGDACYGAASNYIRRQALHAGLLGFVHPRTQKFREFAAPLPPDMENLLDLIDRSRI